MARPRRAVQSTRERRARQRRYSFVMCRLFASNWRSMCHGHFESFQSLKDGIEEFSTMVSEVDPKIANKAATLFPEYPEKMTQQKWKKFRAW
ncbi:hypothetical protein FRX31_015643, partial [Thalictrum thalictroides]